MRPAGFIRRLLEVWASIAPVCLVIAGRSRVVTGGRAVTHPQPQGYFLDDAAQRGLAKEESMRRSVVRAITGALRASTAAFAGACVLWTGPVHAQTPDAEVRGGYAFISDTDFNFPLGWYADIGVPLRGATTLVMEIGRSQTSVVRFGLPVTFSVASYQGGVRYQRRQGSIRPFITAIGGITKGGGRLELGNRPGTPAIDVSMTAYTIQPGGGVVVPVTPRFGVTVGADYRWGGSDVGSLTEFRFATGVSVAVGSR
jgi:hypothetical protein